jgi:large subunit ribosomal protein L22
MVRAELKNQRSSVKKMQLAAKLVRGTAVPTALLQLEFQPQKACRVMLKLLRSAVANAENNKGMDTDEMFISTVTVNKGPTLKRWRARAKGRSSRILKRSVNVVVVLSDKQETK